jgi:hypothetical protein
MRPPTVEAQRIQIKAKEALKVILYELYPVILFYGLYAGVVYLYDVIQPFTPIPVNEANLIEFITSPFSFVEATPPYSKSVIQGLYNNFLFIAVAMVLLMLYDIGLSRSFRKRITVPRVFWAGVLATYAVAWVVWALTGQPSTGTSIMGFTFVTVLAVIATVDLAGQLKLVPSGSRGLKEFARALFLAIFAILAIYFGFAGYLWMNGSYVLHLAGGAVSGSTLAIWSRLRSVHRHEGPRLVSHQNGQGDWT